MWKPRHQQPYGPPGDLAGIALLFFNFRAEIPKILYDACPLLKYFVNYTFFL
jgi:hypothetical protein